jgi:hypothetical protein
MNTSNFLRMCTSNTAMRDPSGPMTFDEACPAAKTRGLNYLFRYITRNCEAPGHLLNVSMPNCFTVWCKAIETDRSLVDTFVNESIVVTPLMRTASIGLPFIKISPTALTFPGN